MPPKRKRPETPGFGPPRPAPHRPGDTDLGQHDRGYDGGNRAGRGGRNFRRGDRRDSMQSYSTRATSISTAPSPISPTFPRPSSSSSGAAQQSTRPPVPPVVMAPPAPLSSPVPIQSGYVYTIITDDRVTLWTQGGRQEVLDYGVQSRMDEDITEVTVIFQEFIHSVIDHRINGTDAGRVVKEILGPEPSETRNDLLAFEPYSLFLDTLSITMDVEAGTYRPAVRDFMMATQVSPALMRQILDPETLENLGLLRNAGNFYKMNIRHATNALYRQSNFNLLREETEGYSKLMTELFATGSGTQEPTESDVKACWEKIKGLIGTFDLDVGRVQDVTMDVFASLVVRANRFFIKLLRVSSWWPHSQVRHASRGYSGGLPLWALPGHDHWTTTPEEEAGLAEQRLARDVAFWDRVRQIGPDAFFELGNREVADSQEQELANALATADLDENPEHKWIQITKTRPPPGNYVAAQILGFKLRFYASEARDKDENIPANLLYLASLLIKVGYISLCDLWTHLWPHGESVDQVRALRTKELEEKERLRRPDGGSNALMMAAALPDDMPPPLNSSTRRDASASKAGVDARAPEVDDKPKLPDDQKYHLLQCLLTIGAVPESLFILGCHDWMLTAYPDLIPLIHRIIHQSLEVVYDRTRPSPAFPDGMPPKKLPDSDQSGVPKGSVRLICPPKKKVFRWPNPDKYGAAEGGNHYRYYWDEWADNVPVCQTVDDVFMLCHTFVNVIGVNIGQDEALLAKMAAIGKKSLADDASPENFARWQDLLRRLLVPALSLTTPNSSVVSMIWDLLKQYPIAVRYNIYAEWYEGQTSRLEPLKKAFAMTRLETLGTMKRLSLDNIPQMARKLAKTAYTSPGVVFKVALQQIEAYSNLIEAFVECAKYFTELGYDVLVWSVLSSLGDQHRSRTQAESVLLTSKWLQALSRFSGKVFQRYSIMDPTPVIQYVNDQLYKGNSTDLVILTEFISSMGGVVSDVDFTDAQRRAMTGGRVLRKKTLTSLGDRRDESTQSSGRLIRALVETKLAGQLLVNIAQYRQSAIYHVPDDAANIKYLATRLDETHQTLIQYLDLLRTSLDADTFDSLVPDIIGLMKDYGLDVGLAFMIGRASLRLDMVNSEKEETSGKTMDVDGDVSMDSANLNSEAAPLLTTDVNDVESASAKQVNVRKSDPLSAAFQPIVQSIPSVLPDYSWDHLSTEFYVLYWSLQLGDLAFPITSYENENKRLKKKAEDVMRDRSDMTRAGVNKKKQEREEIMKTQELLGQECNVELSRQLKIRVFMTKQANNWFRGSTANFNATSDAILEQCILPRIQLSPMDAEYAFRMLKFIHDSQAPNFQLMSVYDRLFNQNRLRSLIFTCTVREAEFLGRFLNLVLGELSRWRADQKLYEKEGIGSRETQSKRAKMNHGFATAFDEGGKPTAWVEHDPFRDLLFKWHKNLSAALKSCLGGMEWMHIRNAITILKSVIDHFPAINFMADKFLELLKIITDREAAQKYGTESNHGHRVDLSVAAQTAFSELQKRKSKWMIVQAFRPGLVSAKLPVDERQEPSTDNRGKSGDTSHSQSPATPSGLQPTAPEFNPRGQPGTVPADVEDGEVKDGKDSKRARTMPTDSIPPKPIRATPAPRVSEEHPLVGSQKPTPDSTASGKPAIPKPPPKTSGPPLPVTAPPRPEPPRPSTLPLGGHGLPVRPEFPSKPAGSLSWAPKVADAGPRDPRDGRQVRDYRDRDNQDRRDQPSRDPHSSRQQVKDSRPQPDLRRPLDPAPRESSRLPERERPTRTEPSRRSDLPPPSDRDARNAREVLQVREGRDRPPQAPQGPPNRAPEMRSSRDTSRDVAVNGSQPAPVAQSDAVEPPINPERARLFTETDRIPSGPSRPSNGYDQRETASRPPRDIRDSRDMRDRDVRDRDLARDQARDRPPRIDSPRQQDYGNSSAAPAEGNSRDDRHSRPRNPDYNGSSRESYGPERESGRNGSDRRDQTVRGAPEDQRPARPNQQDLSYGRLNANPSLVGDMPPGAPSGPRGRGARNLPRVASAGGAPAQPGPAPTPPVRTESRFQEGNRSSPDTSISHAPTGPSSTRSHSQRFDNVANNSSHGNFSSPAPPAAAPASSSFPPPGPGFHPDRMRHISQPPPTPGGVPAAGGRQQRAPLNTPDRHSVGTGFGGTGLRLSAVSTPDGPFTGPQSTPTVTAPRDKGSMGGRQLRGLQDTLEKAQADNGRGPNRPVRHGLLRQNLPGSDAFVVGNTSPVTTPTHEHERFEPARDYRGARMNDALAPARPPHGDARDPRGRPNGDEQGARGGDPDRSSRRDHRSERPNRPSRRSSRERSPEREREIKDLRDYRDRRSDGPAAGHDGNSGRDVGRDRDADTPRRGMRESSSSGMREAHTSSVRDNAGPARESSHRGGGHTDELRGGAPGRPAGGVLDDYGNRGGGGPPRFNGGVGGGSMRESRSRVVDDRGDVRVDDRGNRKRRSEGAPESMNHRDKRPRP